MCINISVYIFLCVKIFFVLLHGTCAAAEEAGFELAQRGLGLECLAVMILEVLALI